MNKLKVFKIAPGFIALPLMLTLSACGKNMHVVFSKPAPVVKDIAPKEVAPKETAKTPDAPAAVVVPPVVAPDKPVAVTPVLPVRPPVTVTNPLPLPPIHEFPTNPPSQVILPPYAPIKPAPVVTCPITAGLGNISQFDAGLNNLPPLPFKNIESGKAYYNLMGSPQANLGPNSKKPDAGYIQHSNELFRSVFHLSDPDTIRSIPVFNLKLTGLRRFQEKAGAKDLSGQVICILDTKICSGEKPIASENEISNLNPSFWDGAKVVTPVFSNTVLDDLLSAAEKNGATVATTPANDSLGLKQGDAVYDMRKLFGLTDLSTPELIQWILDNSTPFADPRFRKFRFVIGNNTYAESGEIQIQEIMNSETDPELTIPADLNKLVNGPTDIIPAVQPVNGTVTKPLPTENLPTGVVSITPPGDLNVVVTPLEPVHPDRPPVDAVETLPLPAPKPIPLPTAGPIVIPPAPVVVEPAPTAPVPSTPEAPVELKVFSDQLGFAYNRVEITDGSGRNKLVKAAQYLGDAEIVHLISSITVMSQTDISGNPKRNFMLSQQRAANVIALLRDNGLSSVSFVADARGQVSVSSCGSIRICDQDRFVKITIEFNKDLSVTVRNDLKARVNAKLEEIRKSTGVMINAN